MDEICVRHKTGCNGTVGKVCEKCNSRLCSNCYYEVHDEFFTCEDCRQEYCFALIETDTSVTLSLIRGKWKETSRGDGKHRCVSCHIKDVYLKKTHKKVLIKEED